MTYTEPDTLPDLAWRADAVVIERSLRRARPVLGDLRPPLRRHPRLRLAPARREPGRRRRRGDVPDRLRPAAALRPRPRRAPDRGCTGSPRTSSPATTGPRCASTARSPGRARRSRWDGDAERADGRSSHAVGHSGRGSRPRSSRSPSATATVLLLVAWAQLSCEEAARALGIPAAPLAAAPGSADRPCGLAATRATPYRLIHVRASESRPARPASTLLSCAAATVAGALGGTGDDERIDGTRWRPAGSPGRRGGGAGARGGRRRAQAVHAPRDDQWIYFEDRASTGRKTTRRQWRRADGRGLAWIDDTRKAPRRDPRPAAARAGHVPPL